jgi:ferredoxin-type protein NapF
MDGPLRLSKRSFLTGRLRADPPPLRPPWLAEAALAGCTGCGACAPACPAGLISIAGGRPEIDFAAGECTFCGDCADACPEALFDRAAPAFRHVAVVGDACLPKRGIVCQSCRDACPTDAIRFQPRRGGPFLPVVRTEACTGCGACVAPCPAGAIRPEGLEEAADG